MKHKNLGVIVIDLSNLEEIHLDDTFNSGTETNITSLLSDEQKNTIIQALKGEKLVYLNHGIINDGGMTLYPNDFLPMTTESRYKLSSVCYIFDSATIIGLCILYDGVSNFTIGS